MPDEHWPNKTTSKNEQFLQNQLDAEASTLFGWVWRPATIILKHGENSWKNWSNHQELKCTNRSHFSWKRQLGSYCGRFWHRSCQAFPLYSDDFLTLRRRKWWWLTRLNVRRQDGMPWEIKSWEAGNGLNARLKPERIWGGGDLMDCVKEPLDDLQISQNRSLSGVKQIRDHTIEPFPLSSFPEGLEFSMPSGNYPAFFSTSGSFKAGLPLCVSQRMLVPLTGKFLVYSLVVSWW